MKIKYWENFDKYIVNQDIEGIETLPLTHNLDSKDLEYLILNKELILPDKKAPIFDEPLLFFYCGIPAYINNEFDYPTILIFDVSDDFYQQLNWTPIDSGSVELMVNKSFIKLFKKKAGINPTNFQEEFVLREKEKAITYIKSHIELFFNTNIMYLESKSNNRCLDDLEYNQNMRYILDLFTFKDGQKHIDFKKVLEEIKEEKSTYFENFIYLDNRVKIIEGHCNKNIEMNKIKPIFCYVPKYKRGSVMSAFNLNKSSVKIYNPDISSNEDIIKKGTRKALKFIKKYIKKK